MNVHFKIVPQNLTAFKKAMEKKTMTKLNVAKKTDKKAKTAKNVKTSKASKTAKNVKTESINFTGNNVKLESGSNDIARANYVTPFTRENTNSANGKKQQRACGSRKVKNAYGHGVGTIGSKIDTMIEHGNFTKKQIEQYAGTKMSKVNAHINHLRKDLNYTVNAPRGGVVSFG